METLLFTKHVSQHWFEQLHVKENHGDHPLVLRCTELPTHTQTTLQQFRLDTKYKSDLSHCVRLRTTRNFYDVTHCAPWLGLGIIHMVVHSA